MDALRHKHIIEYFPSTSIPDIYADRDRIEGYYKHCFKRNKIYPDGGNIQMFAGCLYNEVYIKIKDNGIG